MRAAGSRTWRDALQGMMRGQLSPQPKDAKNDMANFLAGRTFTVSCWLKASPPSRSRSRQGMLELARGRDPIWQSAWHSRHRQVIMGLADVTNVVVGTPGLSDWNVKKGGRFLFVIPVPTTDKITVSMDSGAAYELIVPVIDVPLVLEAFAKLESNG